MTPAQPSLSNQPPSNVSSEAPSSWPSFLRYGVSIAGTITLAIGAAWLVAWSLGIAAQWSAKSVITVKTNMALGQALAGAALLLLGPASVRGRRWRLGAAAAVLVLLIGALTLSEHLLHYNLGVDQLLATEAPGAAATDSPNRMGLYGSVSLALLGAGLLALALRRRSIVPYLGLVVCLINLLPAVGFIYGVDEFYKLPRTGIAWPSVVALISLGVGLVLARSDGGPAAMLLHEDIGGILLRRLLPAMLLVPLALGFLRIQGERHGLYDTATGTGMLAIVMAVLFSFFLWPTAARLSRLAAEQAAAREAVLQSKTLLETFIREAPVSIAMFNRNMCYLQASNRWLQETGVAERNLLGKSHYEIFPNLPERWAAMHRRGLAGESLKAEDDWTAVDGQTHSIRWEIHPWGDSGTDTGGIIISFEDVTERKLARQRIAHLASFPELNQSPIFEADWEGRITYANPAARRLFPTLEETGAKYPLLKEWSSVAGAFGAGTEPVIVREIDSDGLVWLESIHSPQSGVLRAYLVDVTERRRAQQERETTVEFLRLVNESTGTRDLIRAAVTFFQQQSGCSAVGVRLREGDDYPYFEARGFPQEFVLLENSLCAHDATGEVIRDSAGNPVVECMCGNVIYGRVDPAKPFFTAGGSFWANSTTRLLATTSEADRQSSTRNRCNGEGYESVALIPLRVGEQRLGLLQLNDHREGMFSPEVIGLWERLAGHLAVALAKCRAEEAVHESEAQFRTLADAIPQLCWIANSDGWIFWYNQRWYGYTGTTPQQMEGWGWQSVHDPETLPKVLERWKASISTGEPFDMVFPLRGADGALRPFLTRMMPIKSADGKVVRWFGTNTDITELHDAQKALRISEERWSTTLRSIGDAVISTCAQGKIIFMNEVAQNLTGWPLPEAEGKDLSVVFNIVQENTRVKPENPVSRVIRLGKVVGLANHTTLIRRDGAEIPIEDSGAPIRNREGQIEGVVLVFHDVSEQRKVEKVLRDSERLATTGRLAATLAHEIHNPLEAVVNLLFLIDSGTQEEATRHFASMASQELERVAQMTQQMLTFHRESATPVPVQIKEILDNVLALYERKIKSAGVQVETKISFEDAILAQPGEMRQVCANLVGNAIEVVASDHGKIALRAYAARDWRSGRSGLRVVVADNGHGIPAEIREKIFDPFFTTKGESGTGLGLWITAGIVNKYGGTLRLRSTTRAGRSGTCFSLFFPTDRGQE